MLVFAAGCGCEKEHAPEPAQPAAKPVSRMDDPAYREQLKGLVAKQKPVAKDLAEIDDRMNLERKRARAALGKDATDEQVLAELESNPVKYPEWKHLQGRRNAAQKALAANRAEARRAVIARIAQEQSESHPAGRASASDGKSEKQ